MDKTSQREWEQWLVNERHISLDVVKAAGLFTYPTMLSIPVRDVEGKLLFYKHRRQFKVSDGIKYRYDKGAVASLFGAETLRWVTPGEVLVVTEGELDALAMRTLGYNVVSTTGGAGTWNSEWGQIIENFSVVILYDADEAGVKGALKVASMIPNAKIAWVPVQYGKDPTEVIHSGHSDALKQAIVDAKRYEVPAKDAKERLEALKSLQKVLLAERKEDLAHPLKTPFHVDLALAWVEREVELEKMWDDQQNTRAKTHTDDTKIQKAKQYPIRDLIKVNRAGKATCLFHTDNDPSMHVYRDNHFHCFVCGKHGDAITIYQTINNCDFKTAVSELQ